MTARARALLRAVPVYRPLLRTFRYVTEPSRWWREREVRADLDRTRREVGAWAKQGVDAADPNRWFGIISFTNLPLHAKFHCLVAKAMQLRGSRFIPRSVSPLELRRPGNGRFNRKIGDSKNYRLILFPKYD